MKTIKICFVVLFASLAFVACEQDKNEGTTVQEPVKAFYSNMGECVPMQLETGARPKEQYTWQLDGNTLTIKRENTLWPLHYSDSRIYVEYVDNTVYIIERWYSSLEANTPYFRDTELTVENLKPGQWVVKNILEFPSYHCHPEIACTDFNASVGVSSCNTFSIEVKQSAEH